MTIKDIIEKTTQHFKQKGFASARLDAELLFGYALNMRRIELYLHFEKPLSEAELEKCRDVVRKRSAGEPVAYITGQREFYKATFLVGPGVLIPRPETELLVEEAVEWVKKNHPNSNVKILDLGAGSGCISLSLAKEFSNSEVVAIEKSEKACDFFSKNKDKLNLSNAQLICADVNTFTGLEKQSFDVVVSNPPYISADDINVEEAVKKFEPHEALFSNQGGVEALVQWSKLAASLLKPSGLCIFEIGAAQGQVAQKIFKDLNAFSEIRILKDYAGHDRFVFSIKSK